MKTVELPVDVVRSMLEWIMTGDFECYTLGLEDVDDLRDVAEAVGMNPDDVTPCRYRCQLRGNHRMAEWRFQRGLGSSNDWWVRRCLDCNHSVSKAAEAPKPPPDDEPVQVEGEGSDV